MNCNANSSSPGSVDSDFWDGVFSSSVDSDALNTEIRRIEAAVSATEGVAQENNNKQCELCLSNFSTRRGLKYHKENKICVRSDEHCCKHCGKKYAKMQHLRNHYNNNLCDRGRLQQNNNNNNNNVQPSTSGARKRGNIGHPSRHSAFTCNNCQKSFSSKTHLTRHTKNKVCLKSNIASRQFVCNVCQKQFQTVNHLRRHKETKHPDEVSRPKQNRTEPPARGNSSDDDDDAADDDDDVVAAAAVDDDDDDDDDNGDWQLDDGLLLQHRKRLFQRSLVRYRQTCMEAEKYDMLYFFGNRREQIKGNLRRELSEFKTIKWYTSVKVRLVKIGPNGEREDEADPVFRSLTYVALREASLDHQINDAFMKMKRSFDNFQREGSNWRLDSVFFMETSILKYRPLRGSCSNYDVPTLLARKGCIINVTGPTELDGHCFKYAVLAGLYTEENRIGNIPWTELRPFRDQLRFDDIADRGHKMLIDDLDAFEQKNRMSINVYGYEAESVFPIRVSKEIRRTKHVDLLMLPDRHEDDDEGDADLDVHFKSIADSKKPHFCAIKSLSKLISHQMERNGATFVCRRCLTTRPSEESLSRHRLICDLGDEHPTRCKMPNENARWVKFRNLGRRLRVSFVIVANFSFYTSPLYEHDVAVNGPTCKERRLDLCSYTYQRISIDGSFPKEPRYYRGPTPTDTMGQFLTDMAAEEEEVLHILSTVTPLTLCADGVQNIADSNDACYICHWPFDEHDVPVTDHSHVTGKVRGRAHNRCNLQLQEQRFLPVVMEKLSKIDGRILMQAIEQFGQENVKVIPETIETYVSISVRKIRFLDFSRFIKADLDDLIPILKEKSGLDAFRFVSGYVPDDKREITTQSRAFCSHYIDGPERLAERSLPAREHFDDRITGNNISDEMYSSAIAMWETFELTNLGDYLETHMVARCLMFADVVENFRDTMMREFSLDPMHYYSLPGYSWDSCLFQTDVSLELIVDEDLHNTILYALRGGVTVVGKRFARANRPASQDYNDEMPTSEIVSMDFNSLYPSCMMDFPMPTGRFRYLDDFELERFDPMATVDTRDNKGYIVVADIAYPEELHDRDDQYPMCPENMEISPDMVSQYTKDLAEVCGIEVKEERKLCQTLTPKKRYVIHLIHLQHCLRRGMEIEQVHSVIEFSQSCWLKDFISSTLEKRRTATNDFDSMLYKQVACNIFGKTIQNQMKMMDVRICTTGKQLQALVRKPTFAAVRVFGPSLAAVQMHKESVTLNKPIYVGFAILETAKYKMQEFFHSFLCDKLSQVATVSILTSDTDSFILHVEGDAAEINRTFYTHRRRFDMSAFPEGHQLHHAKNKKIPGKIKFLMTQTPIQEAVILSPKCYSILSSEGTNTSKSKRVQGKISHEKYKECLEREEAIVGRYKAVRCFNQKLYHTDIQTKILTPFDNKKFYIDKNHSHSYGHFRLTH